VGHLSRLQFKSRSSQGMMTKPASWVVSHQPLPQSPLVGLISNGDISHPGKEDHLSC
jgi:hypothetical protein